MVDLARALSARRRARWAVQARPVPPMTGRRCYLSPPDLFRLDLACQPIREAFPKAHGPYLVGSVMQRPDHRDVDVRLIVPDKAYDRLRKALGQPGTAFLGLAISAYLRDATGLPIDFQIQRMTEANERHPGTDRNPLGVRGLDAFVGDATPET